SGYPAIWVFGGGARRRVRSLPTRRSADLVDLGGAGGSARCLTHPTILGARLVVAELKGNRWRDSAGASFSRDHQKRLRRSGASSRRKGASHLACRWPSSCPGV